MKRLIMIAARLLLIMLPIVSVAQTSDNFAQSYKSFRPFYEATLKKHGIIGSSFRLIYNNQVVAGEHYGLAHREQNRAVDADTIFHWASITKTFTAIAVMQLRDRGLLKLDDPAVKYLPEMRAIHNPFGSMEEVTIRHLLSHTSGLPEGTWPWGGDKDWHPFEPLHWSQLVAMMPYTELRFKPGAKFSYSNPAFSYLGRLIEVVAQDKYEAYVDKNIFRPLEMRRSYFATTPYFLLKHRSHSYYIENGELKPGRFDANNGINSANGGLNAPLDDMVKYVSFLMGDAQKQEIYDVVLRRASLEEMWQPQMTMENSAKDGENRRDAMGLSYFIEDNFNQHFIGHSGGQNGFISHFYLRPDARAAYIVAFNTHALPDEKDTRNTRDADSEIKNWLFKNIFPLLAKRN